MAQAATDKTANVEHLLHDFTERLEKHPFGWRAVVLNLSRLRPDNRARAADPHRRQHVRGAGPAFRRPDLPALQQGDIVFICKDADVSSVDGAVTKVRYLFGDDPLAAAIDDIQSDGFSTWYDLAREYVEILRLCPANRICEEQRRQKRLAAIAGDAPQNARQPMDPAALAELVNVLARADLTNVCAASRSARSSPNEPPKPIYREVYVSIADLREAVMPKRDIASDRWLFQYLTQTLDRRVLTMLRAATTARSRIPTASTSTSRPCCRRSSRPSTKACARARAAASSSRSRRSTSSTISAPISSRAIMCASAAIASASTA